MVSTQQPPTVHIWQRRRRKQLPLLITLLAVLLFLSSASASASSQYDTFLYDSSPPLDTLELFSPAGGLAGLALGGPHHPKIDRRQNNGPRQGMALEDGIAAQQNILWGMDMVHRLPATEIFANTNRRRRRIFLTFNTCLQPHTVNDRVDDPPALRVFVSNTTANRSPGPRVQGRVQYAVPVDQGFGQLEFEATGDVWVGVSAPDLREDQEGKYVNDTVWNYELALSTEKPYHGYIEDQFLYLVDTDDSTALLITGNMTGDSSTKGGVDETRSPQELMSISADDGFLYQMFAQNMNEKSRFSGLEKSYCAVRQNAQKKAGDSDVSMTTRGMGGLPKQQFLLKELNRSSVYLGYLTRPGDPKFGTSDARKDTSGILWQPMELHTKSDGNCAIIYDLPFCSEAAYAVPSNPTMWEFSETKENLTAFYDNLAELWWANFTYSLQQVQCNASSDAAFSLVRNCDDCAAAYKNWLCAVTIPRCMDHSSELPYLAERSSTNLFWNASSQAWAKHAYGELMTEEEVQEWVNTVGLETPLEKAISRNTMIDKHVMPGPYKEIKPCKDLCWKLVQDCPSSLGFKCPGEGSRGLQMSYGERDVDGDVTCSYLGAVYFLSSAERLGVKSWIGTMATLLVMMWIVV